MILFMKQQKGILKDKIKQIDGGDVAKYNWEELKKDYLLGNYKSVSAFFKDKNINSTSYTRRMTKSWKVTKRQNSDKKVTKTIEKVIEKESTKEANKIVNVKDTAEELLKKINESINELNKYFSRNTKKKKTVEYDKDLGKPVKEVIEEEQQINEFNSIIDRSGLKQLTSALKDINDIINNSSNGNDGNTFAKEIEKAWRDRNE